MRDNPLQFAVVREDPAVERALADHVGARRALLVASGGCTALSLAGSCPRLELTLFDVNRAQLDHVTAKVAALSEGAPAARWNVGDADPTGLNAAGNFESLFRALRRFVEDLVLPAAELRAAFDGACPFGPTIELLVGHPHWPVAFDVHFHAPLLEAMFGPAAVQNAPPGSYPRHFQAAFERGLRAPGARDNRFLHHVLLGHYLDRDGARPPYLEGPEAAPRLELLHGALADVPELERFDLVSLSNIPDWSSAEERREAFALLAERLRPGAALLVRALNTSRPLEAELGPRWALRPDLASALHARDQSLFYSRLVVAIRQ